MLALALTCAPLALAPCALSQSPTAILLQQAQRQVATQQFDSAEAVLDAAMVTARYQMDSVSVLVWRGILERLRGNDGLARARFRAALALNPSTSVRGLDRLSPGLDDLFDAESRAAHVYALLDVEQKPVRLTGPPIAYPLALRQRHVEGQALVTATVDTLGRVEDGSIKVLETPDSGFIEPLKGMLAASTYAPGRVRGRPVRTELFLPIDLKVNEPPPSPTQLVTAAREQLAARRPDSALTLTREALDTATHPTAGERVYALLVQGLAWRAANNDSLAEADFQAGLAGYRDLTVRGVDLAPVLRRLADSVRFARRGATRAATTLVQPTALGPVDEQPVLVSHPPIRYAPEMQALRIGGTVIVEATLDTAGRVVPATVKVVQSPNPVFDTEARRVVTAAVYRPARRGGRSARIVIRQPITFAPY